MLPFLKRKTDSEVSPVQKPVVLAPMAGVSDSPFRGIARRMGSAFTYTEFVSTDGIVRKNRKSLDLFRFSREERPIVFQIFGSDPNTIEEATRILQDLEPDGIDLNMGCSVRKVALKGAGAALLQDPAKAGRIVERMVSISRVPVSAKIRLGWNASKRNYLEVARILEESGVSMIAVHGRTRDQAYGGLADWDAIGEIRSSAGIPIYGNGDIDSLETARSRIRTYGVDGVLIGRAATGNPWIFQSDEPVPINERIALMLEHLEKMVQFYGGAQGLRLFRKHAVKYVRSIPGAAVLRARLVTTEDRSEFEALVRSMGEIQGTAGRDCA